MRDDLGRIQQKTETIDGTTTLYEYAYDDIGQLISVATDGLITREYTYDDNGNRISVDDGDDLVSAAYDAQDRLITYDAFTYAYNDDGALRTKTNTATADLTVYTYDVLGNLQAVALPDGRMIEYVVDGIGRRVGRKIDGVLVQAWLYRDGLRPIAELSPAGAVVKRFVYGTKVNVPEYVVQGGATYRIITDHLGSPRRVVNVVNSADVLVDMVFDEFGNPSGAGIGALPFGFAGGLYDEDTGLVRYGARDYDPTIGRWTSKDPIRWEGGQTNLYVYVGNDAVNRMDALGLWYIDLSGSVGAFGLGLTGGFFFDGEGVYSYVGGGIMTPGPGLALMWSPDTVSPEIMSTQLSGGLFGIGAGIGVDDTGAWFKEVGLSTPGVALTRYSTSGRTDWSDIVGGDPAGVDDVCR